MSSTRNGVTKQPPRSRTPALHQTALQNFGCIHYYLNRSPRKLEILRVADEPRGFATKTGTLRLLLILPVLVSVQ